MAKKVKILSDEQKRWHKRSAFIWRIKGMHISNSMKDIGASLTFEEYSEVIKINEAIDKLRDSLEINTRKLGFKTKDCGK